MILLNMSEAFSRNYFIKVVLKLNEIFSKTIWPLIQAELLGHKLEKGVMTRQGGDEAPYTALMFKSQKSNKKTRFVKLLKGKFKVPNDGAKTKNNNVNYQTATMEGNFVARECDDAWMQIADEDAEGYTADIGGKWFESVEPTKPEV